VVAKGISICPVRIEIPAPLLRADRPKRKKNGSFKEFEDSVVHVSSRVAQPTGR
jgi:hypothetical protein